MGRTANGQHFATPDDPDLSSGLLAGEPCSTIARPTTSFGSATDDGWLYVMGGYHGRPHDYHEEGQSRDFYRVNLHDLSHKELLPNSSGMQSCPLEAWNGKIIRTGGLVAENAPGEPAHLVSLNTVHSYDPSSREWTELPPMPSGRSSHDTAIVDSKLYVIGGWNLDANTKSRDWHGETWVLDLNNPNEGWTSIETPFKRRALATVAIDGKIMVIGGMQSEGGTTKQVDIYEPETGKWMMGPEFPGQGFGAAADTVSGKVMATAAEGGVYTWAPGDEAWNHIGVLTFPRFFHQVAGDHNGDLLIIGGISGGMRPSQVERISYNSSPVSAIVQHWTVPTPSDAKNRQAFFIRNGWIYMFGGNNSTGQHDFQRNNFLDEGYRMNLATMAWRPCSDYPMPRQSIQTVMHEDGKSGFALGGFGFGEEAAETQNEGCTYNFKKNEWVVTGPHLPVSRSQFGMARHGDEIWVFGGLDYDSTREQGDHFRHLEEVMVANATTPDEPFRESGIELLNTRRAFGGVHADGRYYMIGGMTDDFELVEPCDVFDFNSREWGRIASPERKRLSPEAVVLGNHIFVTGGMSPKSDGSGLEPNKSLEMYDIESDTWSTVVEELPFALRHIQMMPFRGQLVIFTSHETDSNLAQVVLINPYRMMNPMKEITMAGKE